MRPRATASQLEQRRRRALHLWQRGNAVTTIARTVGTRPRAVWRGIQTYPGHGLRGLRARPIPGRPSYLSAVQQAH